MTSLSVAGAVPKAKKKKSQGTGRFIMAVLILFFGFYIIYPIALIFIQSFNIAGVMSGSFEFSLDNWRKAFAEPGILESLGNTIFIFFAYTSISFPLAVVISWLLARTQIR